VADEKRDRRARRGGEEEGSPFRRSRGLLVWLLLIGGVILIVSLAPGRMAPGQREELSFNQVLDAVRAGKIERLLVNGTTLYVWPRKGAPKSEFPEEKFDVTISPHVIEYLQKEVDKHNESVKEGERVQVGFREPSLLVSNLLSMVPWILILVLLYYMLMRQLRSAGSGVLSFGRSRARPAGPEQAKITFSDVAGIDEAKQEVMEIIEFLRNPEKFRRVGGRVPRGVLLVGPPGSGKTLLAKAIAGEAGRPFFSISGSDFVEMDGFESDLGVILIAATNRPDVLDPALLRPGRFDRRIVVDLPDVKGREAILRVHARKVKLSPEVDLKVIARGTPYFSGADLENLLNEAALLAVRRDKETVSMAELEEARDKVMFGPAKKSRVIAEEEKRLTAYHEAGHAVVSKLLPEVEPVHKVAIVARGMALGATMYLPEKDRYIIPRGRILAQITSLLGGRAAEQLFCDDITSGAQNDFERATELARLMVCRWGMSDTLGPVSYTESEEHIFLGREITKVKTVSDETAVAIDKEVRRIIDQCYDRAKELLGGHHDSVERLVAALLKYESIDGKEVDVLMAGGELHREENNAADSESREPEDGAAPEPDEGDGQSDTPGSPADSSESGAESTQQV